MIIKLITDQCRRDFSAILICEHCSHEQFLNSGYDDANYHQNVIPKIACNGCGKRASENYRPLQPKYAESEVI